MQKTPAEADTFGQLGVIIGINVAVTVVLIVCAFSLSAFALRRLLAPRHVATLEPVRQSELYQTSPIISHGAAGNYTTLTNAELNLSLAAVV